MATKALSQQGSVPVAKLLAVEAQVGKLTSEMEKLILISTQHGTRIKELIVASSNSVSQVEMMSTVTTSRFQHMNDLKALKSSLQSKYEKSSSGVHGEHAHDEADSKDAKNFTSKLFEVQNEVANQNFKANMEMNKLKMELKTSKNQYDELKRFVEVMETKLTVFIQDAKDSGISTTIEMNDMPEMGRTSVKRRASILAMDGVTVGFGGGQALHSPSGKYSGPESGQPGAFPGHFTGTFPGLLPGQYPPGQFPMFPAFPMFPPQGYPGAPPTYSHPHTPFSPRRNSNNEAIPEHSEDFPLPAVSGSAYHSHNAAPGGLDASQLQQMQILHQQQLYYQQHMHAQQMHAGTTQPAPPMTDSGMSTPVAQSGHRKSSAGDIQGSPSDASNAAAATVGTPADSNWQAAAYRILHPQYQQQTYPGIQPAPYPYPYNPFAPYAPYATYGGLFSSTQPVDPSQDPEAALIASLAAPTLTKEERYYKNQYKAMKELILATMDCKDISLFEPDGSHLKATTGANLGTSQNQALDIADAKDTTRAVDNLTSTTAGVHYGNTTEDPEIARLEAEDRLRKRVSLQLRHQNRDLFRNMRKVKEIEGVALNYADFCVNNAVNMIDGAAYDKFKDILMCSELSRFHEKALTQSTVEVQTDDYSSSNTLGELGRRRTSSFGLSPSNRRRSTKPRALDLTLGGFGGPGSPGSAGNAGYSEGAGSRRSRARSRVDSFGSQQSDGDGAGSRGHSAGSGVNADGNNSAGLPALEPPKPMLLTLQELREAQEEESDAEDIAEIIEMELASSAAPLDFGDAILPAQFSSKGRKATICEFSGQVLRDPALDFLDTSFGDVEAVDGAALSDVTNSPAPVLRSSSFKQASFKSNLDTAYYSVDAAPSTSRPTTAMNSAEIAALKAQMTAVMDKKLMKLYQGLDERWRGLDQTNTGILHKLKKFQDIIVNMNDDSQRLLMSNQVLAGRIAKQDDRLFDALEPMYIALETHKESTERLEGLMMDLSRTLQQQQAAASMGKTIERHGWREGDAVPDLKTVMAAMKPEQMPIDMILRNSHNHAHMIPQVNASSVHVTQDTAHPDAINSDGQSGALISAEYNVLELTEMRLAKQMSEHELDEVLRQLKQYAGMYETMMQNYQVIIKRLKDEDVRKSGNFALKKPHLTGTRPMHTPSQAAQRPSNNQHSDAISTAAVAPTLVPPGKMVVHVPLMSSTDNLDANSSVDDVVPTTDTAHTADHCDTEVGFASPQRVRSQSGEPTSPVPQHHNNMHHTGKPFPFSKKDILALLERSDLSSNVEIVRIKNELARLKNSLSNRRTPSPSRHRGQAPPTTFPSLFTTLGAADFTVLRQQSVSPTGNALRTKGPPAGAGFRPGSARNAIPVQAASALPALSVHNTPGGERRPRMTMQDSLDADELQSLSADLPSVHDAVAHPQVDTYAPLVSVSPGALEPQDDYIVGGVLDDENGLDEKSLSAYEYLTHPHTSHSHSVMLGEGEPLDGTPTKFGAGTRANTGTVTANVSHSHTPQRKASFSIHPPIGLGDKVIEAGVPFVKVRAPVEIVYAAETPVTTTVTTATVGMTAVNSAAATGLPAQATAATLSGNSANISGGASGNTKWGSAASIRSAAITHPKVVSSLAAPLNSPARPVAHNPLLSPQAAGPAGASAGATASASTAAATTAAKSSGAQTKATRKTLAPDAATSIAQARLENNHSREAEKPDPVRSVDILFRAEGIVNGDIAPFSATGSVRTGGIPVPTPPVKARPITTTAATPRKVVEKGAEKRDIRTEERDAKVWQKDYSSMESSSGIMLQSGEFVSEKGGSVLAWDGQGAALLEGQVFVKSVVDIQGSVDSLPLNLSRNLGENAFD